MSEAKRELEERLISSAVLGELGPLREALAAGADLSFRDDYGMSALMHACCFGNARAALELLEAGASLTDTTLEGKSAADLAAESGHCALAGMILSLMEAELFGDAVGGGSGTSGKRGL